MKKQYLYNSTITNDLFLVTEKSKIKQNCINLNIEYPTKSCRITKRSRICILTLKRENNQIIQYIIDSKFDVLNLLWISDKVISPIEKTLIIKAFEIKKANTLNDVLNIY